MKNLQPKAFCSLILILACVMLLSSNTFAGHWAIVSRQTIIDPEVIHVAALPCAALPYGGDISALFQTPQSSGLSDQDFLQLDFPHGSGDATSNLEIIIICRWVDDPGVTTTNLPNEALMQVGYLSHVVISAYDTNYGHEDGSPYVLSMNIAGSSVDVKNDQNIIIGQLYHSGNNPSTDIYYSIPHELYDWPQTDDYAILDIEHGVKTSSGSNTTYKFDIHCKINLTKVGFETGKLTAWQTGMTEYLNDLFTSGRVDFFNAEPVELLPSSNPGSIAGEGGFGCACAPLGVSLFSGNGAFGIDQAAEPTDGLPLNPSGGVNTQTVPNAPGYGSYPDHLPPWGNISSPYSMRVEDENVLRNFWKDADIPLNANSNFSTGLGYILASPPTSGFGNNVPYTGTPSHYQSSGFSALGGTGYGSGTDAVGAITVTPFTSTTSVSFVAGSKRVITVIDADGTRIPFNANDLSSVDGATSILIGGSGTYTLHAGAPGNLREKGPYTYTFNTQTGFTHSVPISLITKIEAPNNTLQTISYTNNTIIVEDKKIISGTPTATGKKLTYILNVFPADPYINGLRYNGDSFNRYTYTFASGGYLDTVKEGDNANLDNIFAPSFLGLTTRGKQVTFFKANSDFPYGDMFMTEPHSGMPGRSISHIQSVVQGGITSGFASQQLGDGSVTTATESNRQDANGNYISDVQSSVRYQLSGSSSTSKVGLRTTTVPALNGSTVSSVMTELLDSHMRPTTVQLAREGTNNYFQSSRNFGTDPDLPLTETASIISVLIQYHLERQLITGRV